MAHLKIGSRPSTLAIRQAYEAIKLIRASNPDTDFEIIGIPTPGDRDKVTPISDIDGSDFFTKEIDEALLSGAIDLAVHSSKDLPLELRKGLKVIFETDSVSPYDTLVSRNDLKLSQLPAGWRVGTSSSRRKEDLLLLREDLKVVDIRGTIEERLALLDNGKIDALIVAEAALIRLGLKGRIAEVFPEEIFRTHPKQGRLSIIAKAPGLIVSAGVPFLARRISG